MKPTPSLLAAAILSCAAGASAQAPAAAPAVTVVRCDAVASAVRDESGKLTLALTNHPDRLAVSRLYAHRFKAM
mgnify:CR=1 FL=1